MEEWQKDLRPASFRGVDFFVEGHEGRGGQRVQVTEVPGKDKAHIRTFGKKNGTHSFNAYIVGNDYFNQRNLLIDALSKNGKGKLVHPYLGNMEIVVPDYGWRETSKELNVVRFTIQFIEFTPLEVTSSVIDTKTKVADTKAAALAAQKTSLADRYKIIGLAITVAATTEKALDKALNSIDFSKRTTAGNFLYNKQLELLQLKTASLIRNSDELFDALSDLTGFGTNADDDQPATADNARGSYQDLKSLAEFEADEILTDAPDDPTLLTQETQQLIAITNQAAVLSFIEFESANEAEAIRTEIFKKLDAFLESTENDDVYNSLYDLRVAVTEDIDNRVRTLPDLIPYIPIITLPALIISHELYGTIDREQEIIDRNEIEHPGFVPGQVELEVLLDA